MKLCFTVLLCALLAQPAAAACAFKSNLTPFAADTKTLVDDATLPAPEVEGVSVSRGLGGGATCDQMGFVSVKVRWPRGSSYDLEQIGFEYRILEGEAPDGLMPPGAVTAAASGRRSEHLFAWQDGVPAEQKLMAMKLEVRAVTPDQRRGPPTLLRFDAAPGR